MNDIFRNLKKKIYIATLKEVFVDDFGNEIKKYNKPCPYILNVLPAGGKTDIVIYGEKINKVYKTLMSFENGKKFNEGDLVYLEGTNPHRELIYGSNANYVIDSVRPQNTCTVIYFKRREN